MRSTFRLALTLILLFSFLISPATAQTPDDPTSARGGSSLDNTLPLPAGDAALTADFSEGFEDITTLPAKGWAQINKSDPVGLTEWFQGNSDVFPAHAGDVYHYIGANFNNVGGNGTISNWLILPTRWLKHGDKFTFYTRTPTGSIWVDRLEIRMSDAGDSEDVGVGAFDVGDFDELLLSINPSLVEGGYPEVWTRYTIELELLQPVVGRLAFRYFVTVGGPAGTNSNYIGIDSVSYEEGPVVYLPSIHK